MLPLSRAQRPSRLAAASRRCTFAAQPNKSCAVLTACTTRCPRLAGGAVELLVCSARACAGAARAARGGKMVLLSGSGSQSLRLSSMEATLLLTALMFTRGRATLFATFQLWRRSEHHLSSTTSSAAGAHFERDHPPRVPRLIPCIPDEPRHLSHAAERPPADLAVRLTLLAVRLCRTRPRTQRPARAHLRSRRGSWAPSTPSLRDALDPAESLGARAAGWDRGRGARSDMCALLLCCVHPRAMCTYICTHGMRVFCVPPTLGVMRVFYIA